MALNATVKGLKELLEQISIDLEKAIAGNKAAAQRVRTNTIKLEKVAKVYRKESIADEKKNKDKKPAKKAAPAKKGAAPAKPAANAKGGAAKKSAKASASELAVKMPTAKIPSKKK